MAKVWSTFSKNVKGGAVNFRIHEVGTDQIEEVVDLLTKYNIPEDPFAVAAGVAKNADAIKEYKNLLVQMIGTDHHIDVVSLDNGSIVGASILALSRKGDPELDFSELKFNHQELKKLFDVWGVLTKKYTAHMDKNATSYFEDWGFVVHPEYQGIGMEEEIFKARLAISKDKNVPLIFSWINKPGLAKAVEAFGWKIVTEINLKAFEKEAGVTFRDALSTGYMVVAKI